MEMTTRMLPLVAAMLAGTALAGAAQQPSHPMRMQNQSATPCDMHAMMTAGMMQSPMRGQMSGRMGGMGAMGGMMNDSSMMVRMRTELSLTDAQMQQLRTMQQSACAAAQPHMQLAMQAHQAAMQALEGDHPSLDHFEDQLDKAAKHMVEAQVEMAKQMLAFRNGLTPEQRQKLDQMHQRMMQGGR
jgi:Spy/CpxP family protein refolding chaperone